MQDPHDGIPAAELDAALNPHQAEDQSRAREHNLDVLGQRGVLLFGDETDDELADLWSAVDRFESVVEARGGDTFTNAPDSSEPENPAFVLPERRTREPVAAYVARIVAAANLLTYFEPADQEKKGPQAEQDGEGGGFEQP
jgi:hypothetical protein